MMKGLLLVVVVLFQCCVFHVLSQGVWGTPGLGRRGGPGRRLGWSGGRFVPSPLSGGPFSGLLSQLQRRFQQRLTSSGTGNQKMSLVPLETGKTSWSRTVGGVNVTERGIYQNYSIVSVARVQSRDPRLMEAKFTGAATLYVFGENKTAVILKPGFGAGRPAPVCFLLPERNLTYSDVVNTLTDRNNTSIEAPMKVDKLDATAKPVNMMQRLRTYGKNPAIFFFCGFTDLVKVVPVSDASFPTTSQTEQNQVLKMVTLDRELQMLVPRPPAGGRPQPGGGPARPPRPFRRLSLI